MRSKPTSIQEYLASLPEERRATVSAVRALIQKHLDADYAEGMQYGMIGYYVPHKVYPAGYHVDPRQPLPYMALASQKNHCALYLMCVYGNSSLESWFRQEWMKAGKKLDMGKSCVRFKTLDDLPLDVLAQMLQKTPAKRYIDHVESTLKKLPKKTARPSPRKTRKEKPRL